MKIHVLGRFLAGAGAAVLLGSLVVRPVPVEAVRPDALQDFLDATLEMHTLYQSHDSAVIQADMDAEIVTVHEQQRGRFHWSREGAWFTPPRSMPERLPDEIADQVGALWDEWRAGFPNTSFVPVDPAEFDPRHPPNPRTAMPTYRVDLPFAWAEGLRVYLVTGGAKGGEFAVRKLSGEPVAFDWFKPGGFGISPLSPSMVDVPLAPETYSPEWPARALQPELYGVLAGGQHMGAGSRQYEPYHERIQHVRYVPGPHDDTSAAAFGTCSGSGPVATEHHTMTWTFPTDPAEVALAREGLAGCEDPRMLLETEVVHEPRARQRSCASGTVSVVRTRTDGTEQVLVNRAFEQCRVGPEEVTVPLHLDRGLGPNFNPVGTRVILDVTARLECRGSQSEEGMAALRVTKRPRLDWPGCAPGHEPQE